MNFLFDIGHPAQVHYFKNLMWALQEKGHEVNPEDVSSMETLKILYYRLKMMDKHNEMDEKLKNR